jgi:hypothetical protein
MTVLWVLTVYAAVSVVVSPLIGFWLRLDEGELRPIPVRSRPPG